MLLHRSEPSGQKVIGSCDPVGADDDGTTKRPRRLSDGVFEVNSTSLELQHTAVPATAAETPSRIVAEKSNQRVHIGIEQGPAGGGLRQIRHEYTDRLGAMLRYASGQGPGGGSVRRP